MASSILALWELPGGLSKNCLTSRDEKPETPPKYSITLSSSSQLCGMFCPPAEAASVKEATALDSMSWMVLVRSFLRLDLFRSLRQDWQIVSFLPVFSVRN